MVSSEFRSNAIRFAERRSGYPVVTIWAMNSGERDLAPIENWSAEDALIVRPHLEVEAPADMLRDRLTRTFGTEIRNATKAGPKLPGIDATDPGPGWPHAGLSSLRR